MMGISSIEMMKPLQAEEEDPPPSSKLTANFNPKAFNARISC